MVYARVSTWKFKPGQRESAVNMLSRDVVAKVRSAKGFRGIVFLFSEDDPNASLFLTMWEMEEDRKASTALFNEASKKSESYLTSPPESKFYKVNNAELHL